MNKCRRQNAKGRMTLFARPFCILHFAFCVLTLGCTQKNVRLNAANVPPERRVLNHTLASITLAPTTQASRPYSGYFIGIALSGGGSRSANFSAACMFQLQRIGLLQRADYISSVSGGSLTAAYYCLSDDRDWNPVTVQRRLTYPFANEALRHWLRPWILVAMFFSNYDRSDMLAGVFEKRLFTRNGRALTFADLRADRPHLLMNSTDLQSGRKFIFCNETFDELNSDLAKYPIAWAATASAAVPIILHQVTLRDYSTVFKQYRHFIDGGIVDNLGIRSLVEVYDAQNKAAAERREPPPYPKGAIFIVVDAKTNFNAKLSDKGDTTFIESLQFGSGLTSTALLERASTATMAELIVRYSAGNATADTLREQITTLTRTGYLKTEDSQHRPIHIVHLALSQVNGLGNVPYQNFGESLDNISTYFTIDKTDAYNLYQAAELLMREKYGTVLKTIVEEVNNR
jgi:predicted acylesterase/phospholipase RssA